MYLHVGDSGSRAFVTIKYADKYNLIYVYTLLNGITTKYAPFRLTAAIRTNYFWDCIKLSYQNEKENVLSFCEYIDLMKAKFSCALDFVRGNFLKLFDPREKRHYVQESLVMGIMDL